MTIKFFRNATCVSPCGELIIPRTDGEHKERETIIKALENLELLLVRITIPPSDNVPYTLLEFAGAFEIWPFWARYVSAQVGIKGRGGWKGRLSLFPKDKKSVWIVPCHKDPIDRLLAAQLLAQTIFFGKSTATVTLILGLVGTSRGIKSYRELPIFPYTPPT